MCSNFVEKFEDTESTCGVATCDVVNIHGGDWKKNDTSESVKLMRRQMVPKCGVCAAPLTVSGQSICVSCITVGVRLCLGCHMVLVTRLSTVSAQAKLNDALRACANNGAFALEQLERAVHMATTMGVANAMEVYKLGKYYLVRCRYLLGATT